MTEVEWLACMDPTPMLEILRNTGKASERKLRLFGCACCRRIWHLLADERSRAAIKVAERYADGLISREELRAAARQAWAVIQEPWPELYWGHSARRQTQRVRMERARYDAASAAAEAATPHLEVEKVTFLILGADSEVQMVEAECVVPREYGVQCLILRDIFGLLPFRPTTIHPDVLASNDGLVIRLAQSIYEDRQLPAGTLDAGRLAILADALLDAGADDEEVLAHLRSESPHVRGCFVLDLILGRK
jgi:hypothetical protein